MFTTKKPKKKLVYKTCKFSLESIWTASLHKVLSGKTSHFLNEFGLRTILGLTGSAEHSMANNKHFLICLSFQFGTLFV